MTTNIPFIHHRQSWHDTLAIDPESPALLTALQQVVRNAAALLGVQRCSVALIDATGMMLVTLAALLQPGEQLRRTRFHLHEGVAGWVAGRCEVALINSVHLDSRFKTLGDRPVGSMLCVPLLYNGACSGTLTVSSQETDAFDVRSIEMLTIMAEQGVVAISNVVRADMARQQAKHLETLMYFAQRIMTRREADDLYHTLLAALQRLIPCQQVEIQLYHEKSLELSTVARWSGSADGNDEDRDAYGQAGGVLQARVKLHETSSIAAAAIRHRHPLLRGSDLTQPSVSGEPALVELAVPFVSKDILYGVLTLKRSGAFSADDLRLVRNLSNSAAVALANVDATRARANFLSMMAHELRSPLHAINGYLDLALEGVGGDLNEQQHEFIQRARAGSEHLYALLEDLLFISRADSGQLRLNRALISLEEIVTNAVEELELTASDYGITINVHLPIISPRLYADAIRLQQVLRNLVGNALRFTPGGGQVTISARLEGREQDEQSTEPFAREAAVVKLQVRDTGIGIAPEFQERIFERFFQVPDVSSERSGGQGLGLAIVKMIVELHGGVVTVESAPGHGSTFTCLLPGVLS